MEYHAVEPAKTEANMHFSRISDIHNKLYESWNLVRYAGVTERTRLHNEHQVYSINPIPLVLSESRLLNTLQHGEASSISKRTKKQIHKAVKTVLHHSRPRGIYRILPVRRDGNIITLGERTRFSSNKLKDMFEHCDRAVVFLTTVGKGVDRAVKKAMDRSSHFGFVMNFVAAAAAEEAAKYMHQHINDQLPDDETTTYRYSPGYCDWPLNDQRGLFDLIPSEEIRVELSETFLMAPSKSVSGVFGICSEDTDIRVINHCLKCPRNNCPHRRK